MLMVMMKVMSTMELMVMSHDGDCGGGSMMWW